jgi:hypothetical protein
MLCILRSWNGFNHCLLFTYFPSFFGWH